MNLNARSLRLVESLRSLLAERRVGEQAVEGGERVLDCGINVTGGMEARLDLARICLADLAIVPGEVGGRESPAVQVVTAHPIAACLASQYAGWPLEEGKFSAMGSGPMRAASAHEAISARIGYAEDLFQVVAARIAESCRVRPEDVTLLIALTASLAGGVQVVARSVGTAPHKLTELEFDLARIVSAHGAAPLPPVAQDDLAAIGRTNDAILYGARVVLFVTGDDDSLADVGPPASSSGSHDYGEPFAAIFARYNHDFYAVDPHLFSPAEVIFQNVQTGQTHAFGRTAPGVLARSFFE